MCSSRDFKGEKIDYSINVAVSDSFHVGFSYNIIWKTVTNVHQSENMQLSETKKIPLMIGAIILVETVDEKINACAHIPFKIHTYMEYII